MKVFPRIVERQIFCAQNSERTKADVRLYNGQGVCFLCGRDWTFVYNLEEIHL